MAVPADTVNSLGSLQAMFHRLAGRSLYCAGKVPGFDTGSALEAAFIAIYRHEMVRWQACSGLALAHTKKAGCLGHASLPPISRRLSLWL